MVTTLSWNQLKNCFLMVFFALIQVFALKNSISTQLLLDSSIGIEHSRFERENHYFWNENFSIRNMSKITSKMQKCKIKIYTLSKFSDCNSDKKNFSSFDCFKWQKTTEPKTEIYQILQICTEYMFWISKINIPWTNFSRAHL